MTSRLRHNIALLGWWNAGWYFLAVAVRRLGWRLCKYDFVAQPVASTEWARGRGKAITVQLASDASALPEPYPRPAHVVADRFAQGAQTLQAWKGEQLAGFMWLVAGGYLEDEVRAQFLLPDPASVWDFDVYVDPALRLGPTYLRLWDEANSLLRARGVHWSVSRIDAFNVASKQAHGRLGTRKLAGAIFLCCRNWQWTVSSCAPYLHCARRPQQRVRMRFDTRALRLVPAQPAHPGAA
jgi:hypothetical protein